ncbi:MAG: bifunctional 5,10-methylene-tetrahydrofolate dehydrogenase/5,10-methylene-tetrahydrofolate cyclohydrolase [Puniceicoccales bacterium]|jgi:methylenetetrahydrofolate dehydrogenase (NADP+)/methenyltetrahydrofolate cyclohydrolase|nr:bifunctional 5,10-methylene-tetrahydrofolate dehydrogenase/5,10-methylene-tetrahydrofolate cyclohydrolase [Puniceicoccales bacterium]
MSGQLLDGRKVADEILEKLRLRILGMPRSPHLALLRVGENPASVLYVRRKSVAAEKISIASTVRVYGESEPLEEVLRQINEWNNDDSIDGILVQAPLPTAEYQQSVFHAIDPRKDVDGFHPLNVGKLVCEDPTAFIPCTPKGIIALLNAYDIPLSGKHMVVIGRSLIVGKPLALLLQGRVINATVTICHSRTENLGNIVRSADVIISAVGQANLVRKSMVTPGTVVVDVGQNRVVDEHAPNGFRLCGDVDFFNVAPIASHITPIPGGVGPMTIAMLLENVCDAYCIRHS